jgi:plasmid stabilization system protein ParE
MGLKVFWTQFAEDKLKDIYDYYYNKVSKAVAEKLIIGILNKTIGLEKSPLIGQREPLLADRHQEFRYLVYKNYKIIYWVNQYNKRIEIVNVFDCRQNPEKLKNTTRTE